MSQCLKTYDTYTSSKVSRLKTMPPLATFEEAVSLIGQLPKILSCRTATNTRALVVDLTEKLGNNPPQQSEDFGFIGMFKRAGIYALTVADPWVDYADPGPYRAGINCTLNAIHQCDAMELYTNKCEVTHQH